VKALFCDVPIHDLLKARFRRDLRSGEGIGHEGCPNRQQYPTIIPNRRFMTEISSDEKIGMRSLVLSSTYRITSPELDRRLPY
jgi:hypothetical protein